MSADASSVAGLFGAAVAPETAEGGNEPPAKKRIILKDDESVAAVLFRPWVVAGRPWTSCIDKLGEDMLLAL